MARRGSTEDSDFSPSVESDGNSEAISAVADVLDRRTISKKLNGKSNKRKKSRRASNSSDSIVEKTKAKEVKLPSKASILVLAQVVSDGTEQNGAFKATYTCRWLTATDLSTFFCSTFPLLFCST